MDDDFEKADRGRLKGVCKCCGELRGDRDGGRGRHESYKSILRQHDQLPDMNQSPDMNQLP